MGNLRPKRLPRPAVDRPRVMAKAGPHAVNGVTLEGIGALPRVIMLVDTSTSNRRKFFRTACIKSGVRVEPVQQHGDARYAPHPTKEDASVCVGTTSHPQQTSFDCWGAGDALARLIDGFAVSWHYAINITVGRVAAGNGPEQPRSFVREQESLFQETKELIEPLLAPIGRMGTIRGTTKKGGCVGDSRAELPEGNVDRDEAAIATAGFIGKEICGPTAPSTPTVHPMLQPSLSVTGQDVGEIDYIRDSNGCLAMVVRPCPV